MLEIRIHGRGGQGSVTAAQLLAIAAFKDGKMSQAFPRFGVERRGAPVEAFCRISKKFINIRSQVYEPNLLLILDSSLIDAIDITSGLKKNSTIIINTAKPINDKKLICHKVICIDASKIALDTFKSDIVNTAILGAFSKVTNLVSIKSINEAVEERFEGKPKLIELNKEVVRKVYESTELQ